MTKRSGTGRQRRTLLRTWLAAPIALASLVFTDVDVAIAPLATQVLQQLSRAARPRWQECPGRRSVPDVGFGGHGATFRANRTAQRAKMRRPVVLGEGARAVRRSPRT